MVKESMMTNESTCGQGLAAHSPLPDKLGDLIAAVGEVLELHTRALDLRDKNSQREHDAYQKLAHDHRQVATQLHALARQMAGYRDLPMGKHDPEVMSDVKGVMAFRRLVDLEEELLELLQARLLEHRQMLQGMAEAISAPQ
jgi:hypothetical protein